MALQGVRVVELAGLAPVPLAGMILADHGAKVVRVDKPMQPPLDTLARGKRSLAVSLKQPAGVEVVKDLCCRADVLLEPFRPGVMERLGLSPAVLLELNPRLVYARLTGFGQTGSLAHRAGHDINYLATAGVLSMLGRNGEKPYAPINLLGDFAGGSLMCVLGVLLALLQRGTSGRGQVVDAAMVDGSAYLSSFLLSSQRIGLWTGPRGTNILDGGAPFYDTYETSDGKFMAVGAIEPQFYEQLLQGCGLASQELPSQLDKSHWAAMKKRFAAVFATKTRQEWTEIFSKLDACVEPVLEMEEAASHAHNKERKVFGRAADDGSLEAMAAPKLSETPPLQTSRGQPHVGQHTVELLQELGYSEEHIRTLLEQGAAYQSEPAAKI